MIAKKVKSKGGGSKAGRVSRLVDYITEEKEQNKEKDQNKIDYYGGRGFLCDDLNSQKAEMIALASDAPKCTNPIAHWVMSWQEDERPTRDQVEAAIDIMLDELGMKDHQLVYAAHQDTDNYHVHLAINRVHPDTLKVPNNFRDVELAHKAVARIEQIQGWQPEQRARYEVIDGQIQRVQHPPQATKEPGHIAQQIESHQGIKSAERVGIETGADLIRAAHSWRDLHQSLAERGMRYEQYGTGAYLYVGDVKLKASSAGRDCSLPQLKKRLGEYQQPPSNLNIQKVEPEYLDDLSPERREYFEQRTKYNSQGISTTEIKDRQIEEMRKLQEDQKQRREEIIKGDWRGKGALLNAVRSAVGSEQAKEREELTSQHKEELDRLKSEPFPEFDQWQQQRLEIERMESVRVEQNRESKQEQNHELSM
ncbi:MAG: relaxase/mobilization nuclease domain-containing protein [Chamaesiphon sp. CSU_1_12]|nr:relaxase/mobilization nuclease domain-containing protein [Chamaesiphon sp. CSU_1_12]